MKQSILKFKLLSRNWLKWFTELGPMNKLNATEWHGKEPRTCKIKDIKQKEAVPFGEYAEFEILVEYRPPGCLVFDGRGWIWDGWMPKHIDVTSDGKILLDGNGKPLPAGEKPVFRGWRVYDDVNFNNYDFGKFVGEEECEGSEGL